MNEPGTIILAGWRVVAFLFGAYLIGSIPTAYLTGRWLRGIDIRQFGSGNVGGNNAGNSTSRWVMVPVGLFDIAKAAIPTWLAFSYFEMGYSLAAAAGLCVTIGHYWSIFLRFYGGRGLSTILGTLVVLFPWGALFLLVFLFIGWRLGSTAGSTVGLLTLPIFSQILEEPAVVTWAAIGFILLTGLKRVEANRSPLPTGDERWPVICRRLWLDRDIVDHEEWLARRPGDS